MDRRCACSAGRRAGCPGLDVQRPGCRARLLPATKRRDDAACRACRRRTVRQAMRWRRGARRPVDARRHGRLAAAPPSGRCEHPGELPLVRDCARRVAAGNRDRRACRTERQRAGRPVPFLGLLCGPVALRGRGRGRQDRRPRASAATSRDLVFLRGAYRATAMGGALRRLWEARNAGAGTRQVHLVLPPATRPGSTGRLACAVTLCAPRGLCGAPSVAGVA